MILSSRESLSVKIKGLEEVLSSRELNRKCISRRLEKIKRKLILVGH